MPVSHEPWLVVLSLIVAIQGAYVGLSLAVQIGGAEGLRRRLLLAGAAISLAVAIWAMHFVGMLAARLPFPVDFLVFPTLLSFLVCVIVVGIAVFASARGRPARRPPPFASPPPRSSWASASPPCITSA
jgi:NO-binding membrane sensor protein with MHYT domain